MAEEALRVSQTEQKQLMRTYSAMLLAVNISWTFQHSPYPSVSYPECFSHGQMYGVQCQLPSGTVGTVNP